MGLRDQFDRLRNYFVEDDDDYDYDTEEEVVPDGTAASASPRQGEEPVERQAPVAQRQQPSQSTRETVSRPIQTVSSNQGTAYTPQRRYSSATGMTGTAGTSSVQQTAPSNVTPIRQNNNLASGTSLSFKQPNVYQDIMEAASIVKTGQILLVNFKNMADQQARRSIDFLTGVAYVLDGDIQNVGGQIFLVTPTGVTVEGARELSMLAGGGQNFENFDLM